MIFSDGQKEAPGETRGTNTDICKDGTDFGENVPTGEYITAPALPSIASGNFTGTSGLTLTVARQAARKLVTLGLYVIPNKVGSNEAFLRGWPDLRINTPAMIDQYWDQPYNVAILTGPSNLLVVDVDNPSHHTSDGFGAKALLEAQYGSLPKTWIARTPHGGLHYYFRCTTPEIGAFSLEGAYRGLDIRRASGQITAPGSYRDGSFYDWVPGFSPEETSLAMAPEWLVNFLLNRLDKPPKPQRLSKPVSIPAGSDNLTLYKTADLIDAITQYLDPPTDYTRSECVRIFTAIKAAGLPMSVAQDWGKTGSKYDDSEWPKCWIGLKAEKSSPGALINILKEYGWAPPRLYPEKRELPPPPDDADAPPENSVYRYGSIAPHPDEELPPPPDDKDAPPKESDVFPYGEEPDYEGNQKPVSQNPAHVLSDAPMQAEIKSEYASALKTLSLRLLTWDELKRIVAAAKAAGLDRKEVLKLLRNQEDPRLDQVKQEWNSLPDENPGVLLHYAEKERKKQAIEPMNIISAADLQGKDLPPVQFAVQGMIPVGFTLICSPPKYGKSWLSMDLCLSVACGLPFLDRQTTPHSTLYLALEDSENRLQDRMAKILQGSPAPENLFYAIRAKTLDTGLLDQLASIKQQHSDIGLIVIDTLAKVRGAARRNESVYDFDYRIGSTLKQFGDDNGVAIVAIHHLRKAKDTDDPMEMVSGSAGLTGSADTTIVLYRDKRFDESPTTLSMTGRDVESREQLIRFSKDNHKWYTVGDKADLATKAYTSQMEQDPLVILIRKLVDISPDGWTGNATDLQKEAVIKNVASIPTWRAQDIGRKISQVEVYLLQIRIQHQYDKSKRVHRFFRLAPKAYAGEPDLDTELPF